MKHEAKEKSLKTEKLFANITYYKLWARKHFGYYIIGLVDKGYRVSNTEEVFNQAFIIPRVCRSWEAMGKEPKLMARMDLRRSQCHDSTMANEMQSDLSNTVQNVVQANHRDGASGIDKSCRMLRSQSEALQFSRQI